MVEADGTDFPFAHELNISEAVVLHFAHERILSLPPISPRYEESGEVSW